MTKARFQHFLRLAAALAFATLGPAAARAQLVHEPADVVKEIVDALHDARSQDAAEAISRDLTTDAGPANTEAMKKNFDLVDQNGKADFVGLMDDVKLGAGVEIVTEYLHFPPTDKPVNQFLFLRFTFMRTGGGWQMTNFAYSTSGVYPPAHWPGAAQ